MAEQDRLTPGYSFKVAAGKERVAERFRQIAREKGDEFLRPDGTVNLQHLAREASLSRNTLYNNLTSPSYNFTPRVLNAVSRVAGWDETILLEAAGLKEPMVTRDQVTVDDDMVLRAFEGRSRPEVERLLSIVRVVVDGWTKDDEQDREGGARRGMGGGHAGTQRLLTVAAV